MCDAHCLPSSCTETQAISKVRHWMTYPVGRVSLLPTLIGLVAGRGPLSEGIRGSFLEMLVEAPVEGLHLPGRRLIMIL